MENVAAYIDGLNLYHSLKDKSWARYYWLDIPKLIEGFLKEGQTLREVHYFSSHAPDRYRHKRQTTYIEALSTISLTYLVNFDVKFGRFESEGARCSNCDDYAVCNNCHQPLDISREKETDVNIAVKMLSDIYEYDFGTMLLVTEDSDQVGTIKTIKELFPAKVKIGVIFPPGRFSENLKNAADFYLHVNQNDLAKNQLPETVLKTNGYELHRPKEWR